MAGYQCVIAQEVKGQKVKGLVEEAYITQSAIKAKCSRDIEACLHLKNQQSSGKKTLAEIGRDLRTEGQTLWSAVDDVGRYCCR
jgi:hypothetical protein